MEHTIRRRFTALGAVLVVLAIILASQIGDARPARAAITSGAQADAQAMLNSGRLSFSHPIPRAQIEAYAAGYEWVNPATSRTCNVNKVLLNALRQVVVDKGFSISISSLNRWCEQMNPPSYVSYHWIDGGGHAVDVNVVNGQGPTSNAARSYIAAMGQVLTHSTMLGQPGCWPGLVLPAGWGSVPDNCSSIHIEYRGADTAPPPPAAPGDDRWFALGTTGTLWGKAGTFATPVAVRNNVASADIEGETVAAVQTDGQVWVKTGEFNSSTWVQLYSAAKQVVVDGNRFIVLTTDGRVYAKDGLYSTSWSLVATDIAMIDADADRIYVLGTNGQLRGKHGAITAPLEVMGETIQSISVSDQRVGVITNGQAYIKEQFYGSWTHLTAGNQIDISGDRIAVRNAGAVKIKEGSITAAWIDLASNAADVALSGSRIGVVEGGMTKLKIGAMNGPWINAIDDTVRVFLD